MIGAVLPSRLHSRARLVGDLAVFGVVLPSHGLLLPLLGQACPYSVSVTFSPHSVLGLELLMSSSVIERWVMK